MVFHNAEFRVYRWKARRMTSESIGWPCRPDRAAGSQSDKIRHRSLSSAYELLTRIFASGKAEGMLTTDITKSARVAGAEHEWRSRTVANTVRQWWPNYRSGKSSDGPDESHLVALTPPHLCFSLA